MKKSSVLTTVAVVAAASIVAYAATREVSVLNLTNTHTSTIADISGEKIWDDDDDQDGIRPESVVVHLYADGVDTGQSYTISADTDWKYEFTDLPAYADGVHIEYSIVEDEVDGYSVSYSDMITTTEEYEVSGDSGDSGDTGDTGDSGETIDYDEVIDSVDITFTWTGDTAELRNAAFKGTGIGMYFQKTVEFNITNSQSEAFYMLGDDNSVFPDGTYTYTFSPTFKDGTTGFVVYTDTTENFYNIYITVNGDYDVDGYEITTSGNIRDGYTVNFTYTG
ncbi:MAG: Cna B-type domain-containing protein [Candidatus Gastranaerophilales bacterium]|nr:Cna B-type domain-containing protein [Candidatus Gastranaerophilales bacterium]